jgi:hypothetical protein
MSLDFVEYLENKTRIKTGGESQPEEQQRLEDRGTPTDFWQSPSLEELAVSQGVKPMKFFCLSPFFISPLLKRHLPVPKTLTSYENNFFLFCS